MEKEAVALTDDIAHTELIAVLTAVTGEQPRVMTVRQGQALPSGPFETEHRSLQAGLRAWVQTETAHPVGYLEQLYTFADRDRHRQGERTISISYLGLVREDDAAGQQASWRGWYDYLPWEDHRQGVPDVVGHLSNGLRVWSHQAASAELTAQRLRRIAFSFGLNGERWNEDLVLQRYELLYEAGLVSEAGKGDEENGRHMFADHRRILATAIARLRAKIKYRPVVFELMPDSFTLLQLQRTVEALAGLRLHKQNFRRLIEQQDLVEETGESDSETGGRPAKLFRFRYSIVEERALSERHLAGTKLPISRD
ncbi:hypothetical protein EDF68_10668 [Ochrobactrum sp. BH3]|nr:hypothetical protein EDF68_10668 [Ochrobactrum sp. BH3]